MKSLEGTQIGRFLLIGLKAQEPKRKEKKLANRQGDPKAKEGVIGAFCRTYSIQEAIEYFLKDVYTACEDSNRYTFLAGSTDGVLVIYENGEFAYSHHGTDPISSMLCNDFDLVRIG